MVKKTAVKDRHVGFVISKELHKRIERYVENFDGYGTINISQVFRIAVEQFLEQEGH